MNKSYDLSIVLTILILTIGAVVSYVSHQIYHRDDAPLEQISEEIVKDFTGIDVDFSPKNTSTTSSNTLITQRYDRITGL